MRFYWLAIGGVATGRMPVGPACVLLCIWGYVVEHIRLFCYVCKLVSLSIQFSFVIVNTTSCLPRGCCLISYSLLFWRTGQGIVITSKKVSAPGCSAGVEILQFTPLRDKRIF